ncbi:MAG TPA: YkgJ family cysteine cluster protein [Pirellulales bacterium]|jgi:hypothetical protein|nr:YkgJ family cysteine cluster protein [Pirellulales bacterium]
MTEKPWYHEGLKFTCTQCGDCCTGAPGYVWVNAEEIAAMAQKRGMSVADFELAFVRKAGVRKTLTERENGDCILLDPQTKKCTVYEARPRQCRTWPFWDSNLRSPKAWQDCCEACPGSGQGKLYSLESIQAQAAVIKV